MKVSIIIRTKNEAGTLPDVFRKIKEQVFDGEIEIIVVDSGSSDNTLSCAREAGCSTVLVPEENFSFGGSINEGIKKARGDFIVLLSGHTVPIDNKWLSELINGFNNQDIAATFGRQVPVKGCDPFEEWQFLRNFPSKVSPVRSFVLRGDTFSNASCAIRREILVKYPFNEGLPGSEDREWASRIKQNGFNIKYIPESQVFHSHPISYEALYNRKFIQAKARKMIYPDAPSRRHGMASPTCQYDNIFWLSGAIITTVLIDIGYCLCKGYFRFLPKIFKYRCYYFKGIINGVRAGKS